jgi:HAE1 family hydrophobic/amphiphilic exporter-1
MWFTRVSIGNPVFATMMMAALLVLGLFSYQRLNVDQFPDVDFPVVVISTEYPGASPEAVEADVTRRLGTQIVEAAPADPLAAMALGAAPARAASL